MRKFLLAASALALLSVPAMSADLAPVYKAAPPPAPVWSWTGFYIGATAGGALMDGNVSESVGSTFCNTALGGCGPAQFSNALAAAIPGGFGNSNQAGFVGGGELGYNWQMGQFVLGFETDISGTTVSGSSAIANAVTPATFPGNTVSVSGAATDKLNYLGTVRGRAGFLFTAPFLAYVTGGLAYGSASSTTSLAEQVTGPCSCGPAPAVTASTSGTRTGWTIGGGVEWMFAPHWTVKAEYLYYDLGSVTYGLPPITQVTGGGTPFFGATTASTVDFKGSIARAGVNYKF
jgi:outer membrane immunogenic protein